MEVSSTGSMWSDPSRPIRDDFPNIPVYSGQSQAVGIRLSLPESPAHMIGDRMGRADSPRHSPTREMYGRGHGSFHGDTRGPPEGDYDSFPIYEDDYPTSSSVRLAQAKVVLLGSVAAGKTSLLNALRYGEPRLAKEGPDGRTIGIEVHSVSLQPDVTLWFYDFGGHNTYHFSQQLFLSQRAIYLLTVDVSIYDPLRFEGTLCHWYNILTARLVAPVICILATHIDQCPRELLARRCADMHSKLVQMEEVNILKLEKEMQSLKEEIKSDPQVSDVHKFQPRTLRQPMQRLNLLLKNRPKIFRTVCCLSSKTYEGIDQFRTNLVSIVSENEYLFPQNDVPKAWLSLADVVGSKKEDVPFVTISEFVDLAAEHEVPADDVQTVLGYLQSIGLVLHYQDYRKNSELSKYVFVNPNLLLAIFGLVFNHNYFMDETRFVWNHKAILRLPHFDFVNLRRNLRERGVIGEKLLRCFWDAMGLTDDVYRAILPLLEKFDLCYEIRVKSGDGLTDGRHFLFPYLLNKSKPPEINFMWSEDILDNFTQCGVELCFTSKSLPFGFLEKVLIRAHTYVDHCLSWKQGMVAFCDEGQDLVSIEAKEDEDNIAVLTLAARVRKDRKSMARHILLLLVAVTNRVLLHHYPGVVAYWFCQCAHCLNRKLHEKDTNIVVDTFPADNVIYTAPEEARDFQCRNCQPGEVLALDDVFPIETRSKESLRRLMSEPCCRALKESATSLMKHMNCRDVMNALLRKQLLDIHQAEAMGSKSNEDDRSEQLLSYLPQCDQKAFTVLCDVLKEDDKTVWLAEELQARASGRTFKRVSSNAGSIGSSSILGRNIPSSSSSGSFTSALSKDSYASERSSNSPFLRRPYGYGARGPYYAVSEKPVKGRWYRAPIPKCEHSQPTEDATKTQMQRKPVYHAKEVPASVAPTKTHQAPRVSSKTHRRDEIKSLPDSKVQTTPHYLPREVLTERQDIPIVKVEHGSAFFTGTPAGYTSAETQGPPVDETKGRSEPPLHEFHLIGDEPFLNVAANETVQTTRDPINEWSAKRNAEILNEYRAGAYPSVRYVLDVDAPAIQGGTTEEPPQFIDGPYDPTFVNSCNTERDRLTKADVKAHGPSQSSPGQSPTDLKPARTSQMQPQMSRRSSDQSPTELKPARTSQMQPQMSRRSPDQSPTELKPARTSQMQPQMGRRSPDQSPTELKPARTSQMQPQMGRRSPDQSPTELKPARTSQMQPQMGRRSPDQSPTELNPARTSQMQPQMGRRSPDQSPTELKPARTSQMQPQMGRRSPDQSPTELKPARTSQMQPQMSRRSPDQSPTELKPARTSQMQPQMSRRSPDQSPTELKPARTSQMQPQMSRRSPDQSPTELKPARTSQMQPQMSRRSPDQSPTELKPARTSQMQPQRDGGSSGQSPTELKPAKADQMQPQRGGGSPGQSPTELKPARTSQMQPQRGGGSPGQSPTELKPAKADQMQPQRSKRQEESFVKPALTNIPLHSRAGDKRVMSTGDISQRDTYAKGVRSNIGTPGFPLRSTMQGEPRPLYKPKSASVINLVGCADLGPKHVMTDVAPFDLPGRDRPRSRSFSLSFKRSKTKSPKTKRNDERFTWASPYDLDSLGASGTWPKQKGTDGVDQIKPTDNFSSHRAGPPTRASDTDLSKTGLAKSGMLRYRSQPVIKTSQGHHDGQTTDRQSSYSLQDMPDLQNVQGRLSNETSGGQRPQNTRGKPPLDKRDAQKSVPQQSRYISNRGPNKISAPDSSSKVEKHFDSNTRPPSGMGSLKGTTSYNEPREYAKSLSQGRNEGVHTSVPHGQGGQHIGEQQFPPRPPSIASSGRGSIALPSDVSDVTESYHTGRSHIGSDSDDATITSAVSDLTLESFHTTRSQAPSVQTFRSEVTSASYHTGHSDVDSDIPDDVTITSDISDLADSFCSASAAANQNRSADLTMISPMSNFSADSFNSNHSCALSDRDVTLTSEEGDIRQWPFLIDDTPNKQTTQRVNTSDSKVYRNEVEMELSKGKTQRTQAPHTSNYDNVSQESNDHLTKQNGSGSYQVTMVTAEETRPKEARTIPLSRIHADGSEFAKEDIQSTPEKHTNVHDQQTGIPTDAVESKPVKTKSKRRKKRPSTEKSSRTLLPHVGTTIDNAEGDKAIRVQTSSDKVPSSKKPNRPKINFEDCHNVVSPSEGIMAEMDAVRKEIVQKFIDSIPSRETHTKYDSDHYIETDIDSGLPTTVSMQDQEQIGDDQDIRPESETYERSKPHAYVMPYVHDSRERSGHIGDYRVERSTRPMDELGPDPREVVRRQEAARRGNQNVPQEISRPRPRVQFALQPGEEHSSRPQYPTRDNRMVTRTNTPMGGGDPPNHPPQGERPRRVKEHPANAASRGEAKNDGHSRRQENSRAGKRPSKHTAFYITGKENQEDLL